jgi:uncharacterized membrane protein
MKVLLLYLATTVVFFAIDMFWLGVIAKDFYFKYLPNLRPQPNWTAAIIFYLIFIVGILIFAVLPYRDDLAKTIIYGALFGFFAYATYDLTNLAVTKDWPLNVTLVDMAWGAFLSGSVATASHFLAKWIYA